MDNVKLPEKLKEFKNVINQTIREIISLKNNEGESEVNKLKLIENESDLFYELLLFTNYKKFIFLKLNFDCENHDLLFQEFTKMKIYNDNNNNNVYNNLLQQLFHMHLYFLIKIENTIASIYKNAIYDFKEIKYSYIILIHIANFLFRLYQEKIYNINIILLFLDAIIIFINKQSIISDRYFKLKNAILFDLLIDKFYLQFLKLTLNNKNASKEDISLILNYLIKALQSDHIKSHFNNSLLINSNLVEKIINVLFNNNNILNDVELYKKYKNNLIDFFSDIYKNNTNNSNFFETLIKQNKNAFVNLMNFETKKEIITNDIIIQNFYLELLYKIFSKEKQSKKEKKQIIDMENFFVFNGDDSKMCFYIYSFQLDNSMLIFSFRLSIDIDSSKNKEFPLFIFETADTNDIIFKIFIKKIDNINKLFIFQSKNKENKQKELCLEKIPKISSDTTYYLVIKYEGKKAKIYILNEIQEKFYEDKEIFEIHKKPLDIRIKIGNDGKFGKHNAFKGCIGPLLVLQNLKIENNLNKDIIINNILEFKNLYPYLPFFLSKESSYDFSNYFAFSSIQEEINFMNQKINIQNSIKSFECNLLITPEIINTYYSFFLQNENESNFPSIPNTIIIPDNYKIIKLDISTIVSRNIFTEFLKNNGFDYFILVYEYFYQYFNIIVKNKNESVSLLINEIIDNSIAESINSTLIILSNYSYYKYIVDNQKKFKTLFRNLYDMLNYSNKISNKLFSSISEAFYDLFFFIKLEINSMHKYINLMPKSQDLINGEKILSNFFNGLFDMIYSPNLYEKYKCEAYLNTLLMKNIAFFNKHKHDKNFSKANPFIYETFMKIIGFAKLLEKVIESKDNNKNSVINSFFLLLKILLKSMDLKNQQIYFGKLLMYIIKNNKNKLFITLNFLNFINEMLINNFLINNEHIELLLKYYSKIINSQKETCDKQIIENINTIISNIIVKFYIYNNSNENKTYFWEIFEKLNNVDIIVQNIILILLHIFDEKLISDDGEFFLVEINDMSDNNDYMEIFEKCFDCIINLFNISINKINKLEIQDENNNKNINDIENDNIEKLIDLLINIHKKLESELSKNIKNKYCIYYLINYLKFYHYITIEQGQILKYSEKKQIDNIIKIIDLINKCNLINTSQKFKIMYNFNEEKKTIIEMIFELTMNIFLNDKNNSDNYKYLIQNYNCIFFSEEIEGKNSIFFATDILRYYNSKKNKKIDKYINELQNIAFFNDLFNNKDKFDGNFTTYFLEYILKYQKIFVEKKFNNAPILQLNSFLDKLIFSILEEHKKLYKLDKNFFINKKFSDINNNLVLEIKKNYIKKETAIKDFKNYLEKYINETNTKETKTETHINKGEKVWKKSYSIEEIISDKNNFDANTYKIKYFFDYDEFYVTNIKKEIMNCIFSSYYLDEFFYDEDFCKVKKYYLNNFITNEKYLESKQLNFPTRIKQFRNNFEPPLFLKKFKNFVIDPYFPITHSYINKINKNNISWKKSINLQKKEFNKPENSKEIECEIIKNEVTYFGKIIFNEQKKYILFKEEEKNFSKEEGHKYIFLLSYFNEQNKGLIKKSKINILNSFDKQILILLDEIEEIVEMRVLLLWKACEIFLKNGKSYLFNFLTTDEYNNFVKNLFSDKIKILSRKRDFLNEKKTIIKLYEKNNITKDWKKGIISNYEYLLFLNRYGSRSFQDPTQYPIFPWLLKNYKNLDLLDKKEKIYLKVIKEYEKIKEFAQEEQINKSKLFQIENIILDELNENLKNKYKDSKKFNYKECKEIYLDIIIKKINYYLRDTNYFPALQNKEKRENLIYKYEEESGNSTFPYHCGNHYSTSGYIYFYLMRQQPYGNLLVKMQGFNLENTNRCFLDINSILKAIQTGNDNRELIPEFFSRIEFFLNLNCDSYGIADFNDNYCLDDCIIDLFPELKEHLSKYVNFIIKHKKFLNSDIIGLQLKKWIDIIFGVKQLPKEEERKDSCVVLPEYSYEEILNLENKLKKAIEDKLTENEIKNNITNEINPLINFGVCPAKIFNNKHVRLKQEEEKIKINDSEKPDNVIEENDDDDLEEMVNSNVINQNIKFKINKIDNVIPLLFQKNPSINKIFVYTKNNQIIIYDCQLFNQIYFNIFIIFKFHSIENSYISFYGKNSVYQLKYSFSSFNNELENISDEPEEFHTYYYNKINYFIIRDKIENESKKKKPKIIKILTCRHYDFSFKIYYYIKRKEFIIKHFSYICEDFVSSCSCISSNSFVIGLNNGKLICFKIISSNYKYNAKNLITSIENINIRRERYIQAHQGKINIIEIDKRLGIIITAGDDNYIFIRKLYDLELLLPIKIKKKYSILMVKISSYNFLYALCYNQLNDKKRIFGYTLSGIRFAKSEYGSYNNINFNEDGNIITFDQKTEKNIIILSGSNLAKINISEKTYDKEAFEEIKKLKPIKWMEYDFFFRKDDEKLNKIITFFDEDKEKGIYLKTLNLSE